MKSKTKQIILLISLIILLFVINYSWMDILLIKNFENINREDFTVKRIIDGDTIVVGEDLTVRLLGINSPERGEEYYQEAKEFLEMIILNKTVFIEFFGKDKYNRELGYVFLDRKNINLELVDEGYANFYFPKGKDRYHNKFIKNWEHCLINNQNLCEMSKNKCNNCIELKKFDYENQEIIFYNKCNLDCDLNDWTIKDEGRKKFVFQNFILKSKDEIKITAEDFKKNYVWTSTGDTLFLRDNKGKLVLWESY